MIGKERTERRERQIERQLERDERDKQRRRAGGNCDHELGRAAIASGIPFLPGVANAGDVMRGLDMELDRFKFFPAEAAGGLKALASLAGPFGDVLLCPTGGITLDSAPIWLAHPSVHCVGGSWIVRLGPLVAAVNQPRIRRRSRHRSIV